MTGVVPRPSESSVAEALARFASVVGEDAVRSASAGLAEFSDPYPMGPAEDWAPAGAVSPGSVEEVQAVLRIANELRVPLWTVSTGRNLGYGGPGPRVAGSVVLSLARMNRVLEIDEQSAYALVEPGVRFFDLYEALRAGGHRLWPSVPDLGWGSVVGNALERGVGYTPYGDHNAMSCGLEVVLPDGDLLRTGMGAMTNSASWQLYKPGFGPAVDGLFAQSNLGVVTKMGLWLMPQPEQMISLAMELDQPDDLGWLVDLVAPMRRDGLVQQSPSIGSWLRGAAVVTSRKEWYDKPGAIPDDVIAAIRKRFNIGWWSIDLRLYGYEDINEATVKVIEKQFARRTQQPFNIVRTKTGEKPDSTPFSGVPSTFPLQNAAWHGGRGGHVGYSPVLPAKGSLALAQFKRTYDRYREFGMDYHGSFAMGERSITNVNQILFNKDDADMMSRVDRFFRALVADATAQRYGEYRTHIDYMDLVAATYDFNDHALRRTNEAIKDALDPNGILAPGKSGVWPKRYRGQRA